MLIFSIYSYNVFLAETPKLRQLLRHEQLGLANRGQDGVADVFRDLGAVGALVAVGSGVVGREIFFKITDLLLEFENLILQKLQ